MIFAFFFSGGRQHHECLQGCFVPSNTRGGGQTPLSLSLFDAHFTFPHHYGRSWQRAKPFPYSTFSRRTSCMLGMVRSFWWGMAPLNIADNHLHTVVLLTHISCKWHVSGTLSAIFNCSALRLPHRVVDSHLRQRHIPGTLPCLTGDPQPMQRSRCPHLSLSDDSRRAATVVSWPLRAVSGWAGLYLPQTRSLWPLLFACFQIVVASGCSKHVAMHPRVFMSDATQRM